MEINSLNTSSPANTVGNGPVNQDSERDLFMALLVAQLKNQDPLSPKDGTEFVAQLAQFNSLDQLIGIRNSIDRLTAMAESQQASFLKNPVSLRGIE